MENEKYTCLDCIWNSQCEDVEPCAFFDRGQYDDLELPDEEIELRIESGRVEYNRAFQEYIKDFQ